MREIFISHAVVDKPLVQAFLSFLKEGIGVPEAKIFCSSVKGYDIPLGTDFNEYIKSQIQTPKLVFLIMTPRYMESAFCMMELGAAWAHSHRTLPIVVPPVSFDMVTKTLGLKQALDINDSESLNKLKDFVAEAINPLEFRSADTWDEKRKVWSADARRLAKKIEPSSRIEAAEHARALARIEELKSEVAGLEVSLESSDAKIEALKLIKDKQAVAAVEAQLNGSDGLEIQLGKLTDAVQAAKPKGTAAVVFRHIVLDYFNVAGSIEWQAYKEEFDNAVKYQLINQDGEVQWERPKLRPLSEALKAVQIFAASDDGDHLREILGAGVPMDPDDLEFWEHHIGL